VNPVSKVPIRFDSAVTRALLVCTFVLLFGTTGYIYIEGWDPWHAFFFTLYTLTTVGYGDDGISESAQKFTAVLMIGGIASVSYTLSQIVQYATSKAIDTEKQMINKAAKLQEHCIVCGLGRTGYHVIQRLDDQGIPVVVVDNDEQLVKQARDRGIIAILGDATHDKSLIDAGINRATAIAATTSSDSINAMICLTAHALAPDIPIAARAEDEDSINKLTRAGAKSVISPTRYGGEGIADSMLRPMVADVLYGTKDEGDNKLHFRELPITKDNNRSGLTIAQLIEGYPSIAYIASRNTSGQFDMRPGTDQVLNDGDFLLVAGQNKDLAAISCSIPQRKRPAA